MNREPFIFYANFRHIALIIRIFDYIWSNNPLITDVMDKRQMKYECLRCGWIYDPAEGDPDGGIRPGTPFKDIPNSWKCPVCGATKADFAEYPED